MTHVDARGEPVSGASETAITLYEKALAQLQCYQGDPVATIEAAIEDSPEFVMAHCLRAYLFALATEVEAMAEARASFDAASGLTTSARERRHLAAIKQFLAGSWEGAISALEDVLIDSPRDALALQVVHLSDFYTGDARSLRDHVARVLPEWSADDPGYHALLAMYAFGLEECGDYARAEDMGRRAIDLNPHDAWAQHAVAHVMEMQGRQDDGIKWMAGRERYWAEDNFFAIHNWWHLALFHLDLDQTDRVLSLYDGPLRKDRSQVMLDLLDASALLWRLHLRDVDVGERWMELADCWEPLAGDGFYAFNDAHAMMAFMAAGRDEAADAVLAAQQRAMAGNASNAMMTNQIGHPVCNALRAFGRGDYATCVDLLRPLRSRLNRFGGSHAQRDIFDLTLLEAAKRAGQLALVRELANERVELKPSSPLNQRYREDAARRLAEISGAAMF
ncbi:tetratricopeptide repeat protein [Pelagibius litoralis]|uniref:Tetratricopeptide repeat protein 38 n=2 Tax=Pelagibius litoralis TaxID=374515 RepID=A0A967EX33_9PROT|nr:tetratricopeptide repeat protein [Pelagibius litoralis]